MRVEDCPSGNPPSIEDRFRLLDIGLRTCAVFGVQALKTEGRQDSMAMFHERREGSCNSCESRFLVEVRFPHMKDSIMTEIIGSFLRCVGDPESQINLSSAKHGAKTDKGNPISNSLAIEHPGNGNAEKVIT